MLMWANLHGGFTLGLVLCAAFALEAVLGARDAAERRTLFVAWLKFTVAAVVVACLTPYGPNPMLVTLRIFGLGERARPRSSNGARPTSRRSRCRRPSCCSAVFSLCRAG